MELTLLRQKMISQLSFTLCWVNFKISLSSLKFSVNYLQDKEDISEEKMLNKFSSSPLFFQKTRRKYVKSPYLSLILRINTGSYRTFQFPAKGNLLSRLKEASCMSLK